ncbi:MULTISPECIES: response regulator [Azospirillum]|uniref:Response regulator n=1 Tax=Azospirillum brasilense TaxID=192 RepID=A0ABU4PHR2_AZOBR|nr:MULTISPECIES: response regulator [Azospirillum]MDX5955994.1 response regulator [Azospirillum brasilense]
MESISTPQDYFILVIEPHTQVCESLRIILEYWGFRVLAVSTVKEAEYKIISHNFIPNAAIVDLSLSYVEGDISNILHISKFLAQRDLTIPVIAITGNSDDRCRTVAKQMG